MTLIVCERCGNYYQGEHPFCPDCQSADEMIALCARLEKAEMELSEYKKLAPVYGDVSEALAYLELEVAGNSGAEAALAFIRRWMSAAQKQGNALEVELDATQRKVKVLEALKHKKG